MLIGYGKRRKHICLKGRVDLGRVSEQRVARGKDSGPGSPWGFLPVLLFVSITSLLGFMAMSEHAGVVDIILSCIILFSWPFLLLDLCVNYPIFRLKKKGKIRLIISLLIVSTVFWLCTLALLISYTFVAPDIRSYSMYIYIAIMVSIAIAIIAMKFFLRKEKGGAKSG
jgi:hypothetical protein